MTQNYKRISKLRSEVASKKRALARSDTLLFLEAVFLGAMTVGPMAMTLWSLLAKHF